MIVAALRIVRRRTAVAVGALVAFGAASPALAVDPTFRLGPAPLASSIDPAGVLALNADSDAILDLVTVGTPVGASGWEAAVLHGRGDGTFTAPRGRGAETAGRVGQPASGDITGDGRVDLVVPVVEVTGNPGTWTSVLYLLRGDSQGGFASAVTLRTLSSVSTALPPPPVAVADVAGDRALDVVAIDRGTGTLYVLVGNGNGGVTPAPVGLTFSEARGVTAGDVNGDGRSDLVVSAGTNVSVLIADGASPGGFLPPLTLSTAPHYAATTNIVDFSQDGLVDLVVAGAFTQVLGGGPTGDARMFTGAGRGAFDPRSIPLDLGRGPSLPASQTDVNGDGRVDLVALDATSSPGVAIALTGEDGSPGRSLFLPVSGLLEQVITADVDGDERADIIVSRRDGLTILLNATPYPAPGATTGSSADASSTAVTLTGVVRPLGLVTTAYFEFGPTPAYGSRTPDVPLDRNAPNAAASARLTGQLAGATVHYRLVASNRFGTSRGGDAVATTQAIVRKVAFASRWRMSRQLGTLSVRGLPQRTGIMQVSLRRAGTRKVLVAKRIRLSARTSRVAIALPSSLPPGNYVARLVGPDATGATVTQEVRLALAPPREGYARAYFSRVDGGREIGTIRRGARVIWVNYRFVSDPAGKPRTIIQTCVGPVRIATATRTYRRSLTISLSSGGVLPTGRYTCSVRSGSRRTPIAQASVTIA